MKPNLFDASWHSVVVLKSGGTFSVTVDKEFTVNFTATVNNKPNEQESKPVYFGGIEHPKFMFGTKAKQNFVGCLQQLFFNTVNKF